MRVEIMKIHVANYHSVTRETIKPSVPRYIGLSTQCNKLLIHKEPHKEKLSSVLESPHTYMLSLPASHSEMLLEWKLTGAAPPTQPAELSTPA